MKLLLFFTVFFISNLTFGVHPISNTSNDPEFVTMEEVVDYSNEEFELHFDYELSFWEKLKWFFIKRNLKRIFSIFPGVGKITIPVKSDPCKRIELKNGTVLKVLVDEMDESTIYFIPCKKGKDKKQFVHLDSVFTITSMDGKKLYYHAGSKVDDMDKLEKQLKRMPIKTTLPALFLGIIGFVIGLFVSGVAGFVLTAIAVILSLSGIRRLRKSKGMSKDKVLVNVGMAINVIAFFALIVLILIVIGF